MDGGGLSPNFWDYKSIYMSFVNLMVSIKKSKKPLKILKFD